MPLPLNTNFLDLLLLTRRYNTSNSTQPQFTTHVPYVTRQGLAKLEEASTTRFQDDIDVLIFHLLRIRRHEQAGESKPIDEDIVDIAHDVKREHKRLVQETEKKQSEAAAKKQREERARREEEQILEWDRRALNMNTQFPNPRTTYPASASEVADSMSLRRARYPQLIGYDTNGKAPNFMPGHRPLGFLYGNPLTYGGGYSNRNGR